MNPRTPKLLFLFVVSYVFMYLLSNLLPDSIGLKKWVFTGNIWLMDYQTFLLPVFGFFAVYLLIPWLKKELGFGDLFISIFPIVFAVVSYLAFELTIFWYYASQLYLNYQAQGATAAAKCFLFLCLDLSPMHLDYWLLFIGSHFFYFVLSGILGWLAWLLLEHFESQSSGAQATN